MTGVKPQQIGGEVGEVRANINVDNLNAYLEKSVPAVRAPVAVKQFKVCPRAHLSRHRTDAVPVWTGAQGYICFAEKHRSWLPSQSNPTYFLTDSRCVTGNCAMTQNLTVEQWHAFRTS